MLLLMLLLEGRHIYDDDDAEVLGLAKRSGFLLEYVAMKNMHHCEMFELLITRA